MTPVNAHLLSMLIGFVAFTVIFLLYKLIKFLLNYLKIPTKIKRKLRG